jgi:magnesium chelatase family protein
MAPSDIRKTGTIFDLAIGVALLVCIHFDTAYHKDMLQQSLFFGELSLDGNIKKVSGILPAVIA